MVYTYLISEELNWTSDMDSEMDRLHKASLFASSTSINLLSVEITVVAALSGNIQLPHTCKKTCVPLFLGRIILLYVCSFGHVKWELEIFLC